jgi:RPA family protein
MLATLRVNNTIIGLDINSVKVVGVLMNKESEGMWKEADVAQFKLQHI